MLQRYDLYKTPSLIYAKNNWILPTKSGPQLYQFGGHRLVGVDQFIGARCQLANGLISRIAFDLACAINYSQEEANRECRVMEVV
jgi:hypothetical protein